LCALSNILQVAALGSLNEDVKVSGAPRHHQQVRRAGRRSYLKEHVSWLDATVRCYRSSLHDGADINPSVSSVVALTDDTDAQEVVSL